MELYDLSDIKIRKRSDRLHHDWKNSVGRKIGVRINNSYVYYTIISYDTKTGDISLSNDIGETHTFNRYIFKTNKKDVAANKITYEHLFQCGNEVNGYLILKKIRLPHPSKKNCTIKGYKVSCLCCKEELELTENNIIRKKEGFCMYCSPKCKTGINDMFTTHPEIASLLKNKEDGYKYKMNYSVKKLSWICPHCGEEIFATPYYVKKHGIICRKCSGNISLPERIMYCILSSLKVNFECQKLLPIKSFILDKQEYTPSYDFYFEIGSSKYIIEMDGGFHNKVHSNSKISIEKIKEIDEKKDELARLNGCIIIRIESDPSTFDNIYQNIISNKILNEIFDFSIVNENDVLKYCCLNNMVKEICQYYDKKTKDMHKIASHFHVSYNRVYNYLKLGAKLNWTTYVPEKQLSIMKPVHYKYSYVCNELSLIFKNSKALETRGHEFLGFDVNMDNIYNHVISGYGDVNGFTFSKIEIKECEEIEKILPNIVIE